MKTSLFTFIFICFYIQNAISQVTLDANGAGNTYEDITAVLAPGFDPVEEPDCSHNAFGRHIDEVFDTDLGINVFRFFMHTTPDNDRCINFDRQRNEIKTYNQSPDNLKAVEDETVTYIWKFKIDAGFQSSSSFTHLHQLKFVGGTDSMPLYTLTARKGTPDKLQLRYALTTSQITLQEVSLEPFKGAWVQVEETITYSDVGAYSILITRVADNSVLFNYNNTTIDNWRNDNTFCRPKWGIYRSLNVPSDLRDEEVLFANFSIEEIENSLSVNDLEKQKKTISLFPNPVKDFITIKESEANLFDSFLVYNSLGKLIPFNEEIKEKTLNISVLKSGLYFFVFKKGSTLVSRNKIIVK